MWSFKNKIKEAWILVSARTALIQLSLFVNLSSKNRFLLKRDSWQAYHLKKEQKVFQLQSLVNAALMMNFWNWISRRRSQSIIKNPIKHQNYASSVLRLYPKKSSRRSSLTFSDKTCSPMTTKSKSLRVKITKSNQRQPAITPRLACSVMRK